jgi:hypothetical protein
MKRLILVLITFALLMPLWAQAGSPSGFSAGMNLGSDLLPNPSTGTIESWSKLGFQPDLAVGKFGVGLDLTFRFQLNTASTTNPLVIYAPDWIPQPGQTIFDVYLPKIMYVRYGIKGDDPLYAKLGSINDFTLGNGLIISDYANTRFLPKLRIFGLEAGFDGSLFKVPYFGVDLLTGNLAKLDVVGGRFYVRPLGFMGDSILGRLQLGATGVMDRDPYLYTDPGTASLIYEYGADITDPILTGGLFSMTAFVEGAKQGVNNAMGAAGGFKGKIISLINYGAQISYLQRGFIPSYFDANYDFYRTERYNYINTTQAGSFVPGWQANLGFNLFNQKFVFGALLSGPFAGIPSAASDDSAAYPHLKGSIQLVEGMISGLFAEGSYEKYFIGRANPSNPLKDLIDPTDAAIGLALHYKTGATVLTLDYAYRWNPSKSNGSGGFGAFDVSSSLSAEVRF